MLDYTQVFDTIEKMQAMKRYKAPSKNYFPTAAEIMTYANSDKWETMIPYFIWLEDSLDSEGRAMHKEARQVLAQIMEDKVEKGDAVR